MSAALVATTAEAAVLSPVMFVVAADVDGLPAAAGSLYGLGRPCGQAQSSLRTAQGRAVAARAPTCACDAARLGVAVGPAPAAI